jgi:hypothetical protein
MHIFHVHAEKEPGGTRDARTWLVISDNLLDATSLVPGGFRVKAVEIQRAAVAGPGRVIGCFAALAIDHGWDGSIVGRVPASPRGCRIEAMRDQRGSRPSADR